MNDDLRDQLQSIDPMPPDVPVESVTATAARKRLEHIMNTQPIDHDTRPARLDANKARTPKWRSPQALLGAAAAAAIVVVGSAIALNNNGTGGSTGSGGGSGGEVAQPVPLELSLGASDAMSSCMMFDVNILADMSPAFAATALAVEGETVTLDVDTWYAGGDAEQVVLHAAQGMEALIDGFDFEVGQQYLITAAEGTVNFCGYSGPATPELTEAFEQAFAD